MPRQRQPGRLMCRQRTRQLRAPRSLRQARRRRSPQQARLTAAPPRQRPPRRTRRHQRTRPLRALPSGRQSGLLTHLPRARRLRPLDAALLQRQPSSLLRLSLLRLSPLHLLAWTRLPSPAARRRTPGLPRAPRGGQATDPMQRPALPVQPPTPRARLLRGRPRARTPRQPRPRAARSATRRRAQPRVPGTRARPAPSLARGGPRLRRRAATCR